MNKVHCPLCKTVSKGFCIVKGMDNINDNVDLDATSSGGGKAVAAQDVSQQDINDESEEKFDNLRNEWGKLWKELETLYPELITAKAKEEGDNISYSNDSSLWDNGQDEVAAICANFIDLTQGADQQDSDNNISSKNEKQLSLQELEQLQEKEQRACDILQQLKKLHDEIMQVQLVIQSSGANNTMSTKRAQRLRSEVLKLQCTNADLASQVDTLTSTVEDCREALTARTIETEREKRKAKSALSEFKQIEKELKVMESFYQKSLSKATLEKNALETENERLRNQLRELSSKSGLQDLEQMEEMRGNYKKMSEDVHTLRNENRKLKNKLAAQERDLDRGRTKEMRRPASSENVRSRAVSTKKMPSKKHAAVKRISLSEPKEKQSSTSKAMDILDKTPSRKRSLQQEALLMPRKRSRATSFVNVKAKPLRK